MCVWVENGALFVVRPISAPRIMFFQKRTRETRLDESEKATRIFPEMTPRTSEAPAGSAAAAHGRAFASGDGVGASQHDAVGAEDGGAARDETRSRPTPLSRAKGSEKRPRGAARLVIALPDVRDAIEGEPVRIKRGRLHSASNLHFVLDS